MDKITRKGKALAEGALQTIGKWLVIGYFVIAAYGIMANAFGWGVDNSDADNWHRSGLRIYTDHLTGVQYVRAGDALCVRVDANGDPVLSR